MSGGSVVKSPYAKQEMQIWSLGQEDPSEKEIAFHSSILAWNISWTEEPRGCKESDTTWFKIFLFLRIPWEGYRCLRILIAHLFVVPKCCFQLPGHLQQLHPLWVSVLSQPILGGFTLSVDTVLLPFQHEHRAEIKQVTN